VVCVYGRVDSSSAKKKRYFSQKKRCMAIKGSEEVIKGCDYFILRAERRGDLR
jgi:hypothetical protein